MNGSTDKVIEGLVAVAGALGPEEQAELVRRLVQQLGTCRPGAIIPAAGAVAGDGEAQRAHYGGSLLRVQPGPVNPADYDDLTYKITGCAYRVHRQLGSGHRESVYQEAMEEELKLAGLSIHAQRKYEVYDTPFGGHRLGLYIADLVVANTVIVELKALSALDRSHLNQVICYLKVSGCPVGLLLNFGERSLNHRRVLPPKNIDQTAIEHQWLYKPDTAPPIP